MATTMTMKIVRTLVLKMITCDDSEEKVPAKIQINLDGIKSSLFTPMISRVTIWIVNCYDKIEKDGNLV